ncbi:DUF502 domain-containing protein, partial [bacterium]|nr:DUF502 domain-containing protein [bacterium]MBU1600163.1 DUF502 domain-containing protein [bacterium]
MGRFKRYFITGLIAIIPIAATLAVVAFCFSILNKLLSMPFSKLFPIKESFLASCIDLSAGILLAILLLITIGYITEKIGKRGIFRWAEGMVKKLPVISYLYTSVKQLVELVNLNKSEGGFIQMVLVEYPRKGIYSLGFVTSKVNPKIASAVNMELINVYLPFALALAQGILIIVPKKDVIGLDISVEEGYKLVV